MTEDIKNRTQHDWIKTVTLTPEQVQQMIDKKLQLMKHYSVNVRRKPACKFER